MRILISNFITSLMNWFFSTYPKFTYTYGITGTAIRYGVTYKLIFSQVDANSVLKFYFTSTCTTTVSAGPSPALCFNPSNDCDASASCALSVASPSYNQFSSVPGNQTTLIIQIRLPQDIT